MIVGAPARRVRDVREDEQRLIAFGADVYVKRHRQYAKGLRRLG
jgi:carbonic anhydrase/acetyltransferase-like protein (isoleucine patch superfamily)